MSMNKYFVKQHEIFSRCTDDYPSRLEESKYNKIYVFGLSYKKWKDIFRLQNISALLLIGSTEREEQRSGKN